MPLSRKKWNFLDLHGTIALKGSNGVHQQRWLVISLERFASQHTMLHSTGKVAPKKSWCRLSLVSDAVWGTVDFVYLFAGTLCGVRSAAISNVKRKIRSEPSLSFRRAVHPQATLPGST
jgi:hypothetical protein